MNSQAITSFLVFVQVLQIIKSAEVIQLKLQEIHTCENYVPEAGGLKVRYDLKKTNSEVSLSGSMDIGFTIDDSIEYGLNASLWSEDENTWNNILAVSGNACDVLLFIPKLWSKVAEAAKVSSKCPIQPGHYELLDFTLDPKDADLPIILEGKFSIQMQMYNDGKSVICQRLVLEGRKSNV